MATLEKQSVPLPPSSSNFWFNLFGLGLFFLLGAALIKFFPRQDRVLLAMSGLLSLTVVHWIYDLCFVKVQMRPSAQLNDRPGAFDRDRYLTKLTGLYGTFVIILFLYWMIPFYRESARAVLFYGKFFSSIQLIGPWIIVLSWIYFAYIDRRQKNPYDAYWHAGCLFLGRWKQINFIYIKEHARVWFIKAFFTPFMFGLLIQYLDLVLTFNFWSERSFSGFYNHFLNVFYSFDVIYGFLGYFLTFRLTDNHIQSTEPKVLGWLVCLACYHPFYNIFGIGLLQYQGQFSWEHWLSGTPIVYYIWGVLIIGATAVYGLATVAFGYRMSNLTYRGIITDGPYRWTKHPAYIGKVASWWLISLPFLSLEGPVIAIQQTMALLVISLIYYLRARTEENHLANYPEYVQYAKWIDQHGIFSPVKRIFPALCFSEEKVRRYNSVVWFKKLKEN